MKTSLITHSQVGCFAADLFILLKKKKNTIEIQKRRKKKLYEKRIKKKIFLLIRFFSPICSYLLTTLKAHQYTSRQLIGHSIIIALCLKFSLLIFRLYATHIVNKFEKITYERFWFYKTECYFVLLKIAFNILVFLSFDEEIISDTFKRIDFYFLYIITILE